MNGWSARTVMNGNKQQNVIPAKAGIHRSASARQRLLCSLSRAMNSRFRGNDVGDFGLACCLFLLSFIAIPSFAHAQESAAQALYGVKEILVRPVKFDDPALAKTCRLEGGWLDELIMKELQDNGLPAVAENNASPSTMNVARIILVPQIVPFNSQGLDCITWVALSAESRNHLRVLPVEIPRVINVIYWRRGELVTSAVSVHGDHVTTSLRNMIREFGQRYKLAQPPTVGKPTAPAPR
jgi:hypothetical protein